MQRLNGRVAIMHYLGVRNRAFFRRWRRLGLPVYQAPTDRPFAVREELNAWQRPPHIGARSEHRGERTADGLTPFMRRLLDTLAQNKGRTDESKR
jgi:hypothetical protein